MAIVRTQIERLKKDLRKLEKHEKNLIDNEQTDMIKNILLKKQWLVESIENLQIAA